VLVKSRKEPVGIISLLFFVRKIETIKARRLGFGMQTLEVLAQRIFISTTISSLNGILF